MSLEVHVRICEGVGGKFPGATRLIIVCKSEAEAQKRKEKVSSRLRERVGLELSSEKSSITHISQGFDFLGFNIRKYEPKSPHSTPKLIIKPAKENVTGYLRDIRQTIRAMRQATTEDLIKTLNPKIQGWGLYYRYPPSIVAMGQAETS